MRIAVAGGTGLVGRHTVAVLRDAGHDTVVISRSHGVDLVTGSGLEQALQGVRAVIDVTNARTTRREDAIAFFRGATQNLLAAELRAGVRLHVLLSIVGVDRLEGNAHYAGKRAQEELVLDGPVPFTIQRATQFHEFAGMLVDWLRRDGRVSLPALRLQPVAALDVARVLAELATGEAQGRAPDLAGPDELDLIDMARRTVAARGESVEVVVSPDGGFFGPNAESERFLPGPGARLGPTRFDDWVASLRAAR